MREMGRELIASVYVTLDGVMEDPGGAEGFEHGGWSMEFFDDDAANFAQEQLFASDALLLGRITYQGFAESWPSMTDEEGFADRMNELPKYVASETLGELEWNNAHPLEGNVSEEVAKLKREPGDDILIYGSRQLVGGLMRDGLIDEYRLWVHPVVLGSGKRLFPEGTETTALELAETTTFSSGVVVLSYRPKEDENTGGDSRGGA